MVIEVGNRLVIDVGLDVGLGLSNQPTAPYPIARFPNCPIGLCPNKGFLIAPHVFPYEINLLENIFCSHRRNLPIGFLSDIIIWYLWANLICHPWANCHLSYWIRLILLSVVTYGIWRIGDASFPPPIPINSLCFPSPNVLILHLTFKLCHYLTFKLRRCLTFLLFHSLTLWSFIA